MKLIADENIDSDIVLWLRSQGEDVFSIKESMPGRPDEEILARANAEQRIILTKDMDFGELVYHEGLTSEGIILLRLKGAGAQLRLKILQENWGQIAIHAAHHFVVVSQARLRIRPIRKP